MSVFATHPPTRYLLLVYTFVNIENFERPLTIMIFWPYVPFNDFNINTDYEESFEIINEIIFIMLNRYFNIKYYPA